MAEGKLVEVDDQLGGVELKFAKAASLNLAQADQIVDLKVALEACESKWYGQGFADAKKSAEPVVHQTRIHGFGEGWLVAFQVMGVLEDSPLRDPGQIPYPTPPPPSQSQADDANEEETTSIRELVQAIDAHVNIEVSSNLQAADNVQA